MMNPNDFIVMNANKFPRMALPALRQEMQNVAPQTQYQVMSAAYKEPVLAWVLSFFLGMIGVDRFYVGDTGLGIGKLLLTIFTFGMLGWIWWFVDLFLILNRARRANYERAMMIMAYAPAADAPTHNPQDDVQDDDADFDDF